MARAALDGAERSIQGGPHFCPFAQTKQRRARGGETCRRAGLSCQTPGVLTTGSVRGAGLSL